MNNDLGMMMKRVFGAAEWRETFIRTKDATKKFKEWLYSMYLISDAWNRKKTARRKIDGDRCQGVLCFSISNLQVHHKTYDNIGDEDVENDLVTLCDNCHKGEHGLKREELFPMLIQLPSDVPDYSDRV